MYKTGIHRTSQNTQSRSLLEDRQRWAQQQEEKNVKNEKGLAGDDKVTPAGHREYKSADKDKKQLFLPEGAEVEFFDKEEQTLASDKNVKIDTPEGAVRAFTIEGKGRYVATYDKEGQFKGYKNYKTNTLYSNPAGLEATGTVSEVSWGESSGLYPMPYEEKEKEDKTKEITFNHSNSDLYNPEKWDYNSSKELLKARAAMAYVAENANPTVHLAKPNSKSAIHQKLQIYHLKENLPSVDTKVKNAKAFYLSPDPTKIHTGLNTKMYNVTILKAYGPFYNIGGGDVKRGPYILYFTILN